MENRMMMAVVAAMMILALGYMVPSAYAEDQPSGVQGLWSSTGGPQCQYQAEGTQLPKGMSGQTLGYQDQGSGVQGMWSTECRCGVQLTQPSKWIPWPDYASQPSGIQGMWPSEQNKC